MLMNEDKSERRAVELIQELEIDSQKDAEKYEKCETAARLASKEVLEKIDNSEEKAEIKWIKESHKKGFPSLDRWRNGFAQELKDLIKVTGGLDGIKKWHELEAICEELAEQKIEKMGDSKRRAIEAIKNIHERSSERRIEILRKINERSEPE